MPTVGFYSNNLILHTKLGQKMTAFWANKEIHVTVFSLSPSEHPFVALGSHLYSGLFCSNGTFILHRLTTIVETNNLGPTGFHPSWSSFLLYCNVSKLY